MSNAMEGLTGDLSNLSIFQMPSDCIRVAESGMKGAGLGLVATKDIAAGTEIFRKEVSVQLPKQEQKNELCDWCHSIKGEKIPSETQAISTCPVVDVKLCAGCVQFGYCSKTCQKKAWQAYHKLECKAYTSDTAKLLPIGNAPCHRRTILRLLAMSQMRTLSPNDLRAILSLKWSERSFAESGPPEQYIAYANWVATAMPSQFDVGTHVSLLASFMVNSMALSDSEGSVGRYGVDTIVSLMNHSCDANAHYFALGRQVCVRAIRAIKAGEDINLSYDRFERQDVTFKDRRAALQKKYHFDCQCSFCMTTLAKFAQRSEEDARWHDKLAEAQKDLVILLNSANLSTLARIRSFEQSVAEVQRTVYPNNDWPSDTKPAPMIAQKLSEAYLNHDPAKAFQWQLREIFGSHDPTWTLKDPSYVNTLRQLAGSVAAGVMMNGRQVPLEGEFPLDIYGMSLLITGLYSTLFHCTKIAFGEDAPQRKGRTMLAGPTLNYVGRVDGESVNFRRKFKINQDKLLRWAGVPLKKAIKFP